MIIRITEERDIPAVLALYEDARAFMRENGNGGQWGDRYPSEEDLRKDMQAGASYVCVDERGESGAPAGTVVGTFAYFYGEDPDPNYVEIRDGAWPDRLPYGVVHRITTLRGTHGVAVYCLDWAYGRCHHLRIDTHRKNIPMQNLVRKCGFEYCGIVRMIESDGTDRDAFMKV